MRIATSALALLWLCTSGAQAQVPYLDDRSDAAMLVQSLYNAINRKEYARAFEYFAKSPAKSFEDYAKGFVKTQRVEVATGKIATEGAAGSTFFTVPVAIKATDLSGGEKVFAGCYTVRQVSATIQEPPFRALRIDSGKLKPSDSFSLEGAMPDCGADPTDEEAVSPEEAIKAYVRIFAGSCAASVQVRAGATAPQQFTITYRQDSYSETDSKADLFQFPCNMAAYNETNVFLLRTDVEGLQPVALASPVLKIDYEDEEQTKLKAMRVEGFDTQTEQVNADFDAKTNSLSTYSKWRGVGDASSSGSYRFVDGRFVLWDYTVDPTTNGDIDPYRVIQEGKVLPQPVAETEEDLGPGNENATEEAVPDATPEE